MDEELLRIIELFDDEVVTTADRIDRPQRALDRDAIDDFMKRNPIEKADGGRIGFYKGEKVVKSHGKQIKDLTEAGESSVSIAKLLKLKQQTVNAAMDAMDKGIAGEEFKLSKPRKDIIKKNVNQTGINLKDPKHLEEVIQWIDDNPKANQKDAIKIFGRRKAQLVDASLYGSPGKKWDDAKVKLRNKIRSDLTKLRSSPSLEAELGAPKKSGLNFHHAGFKESLADLKNTMYIPGSPNRKMVKLFEDPLLKEMEAFTKVFDNPKATTKEKQKAATNYLKNDRALRKKYPEFKNFKTRLSFRRTSLDKSGIMFKEKLPDPSLAISQEPGMTLKGETPTTQKGKQILEFGKKSLEQNIFKRFAVIGCGPEAAREGGRINFDAGSSVACIRKGMEKVKNKTNLSPADRINISKINDIAKTAKGARAISSVAKFAVGPLGIPLELAIGGFFAATDFATGANKKEIISNLTFGLGGQSMEEQLKEDDPMYGKADKLTETYAGYLSGLNKLGEERDPLRLRPGKKTTEKDVLKAMEPFTRVNPQLEGGDFFDFGMYEKRAEKDRESEATFAEEKLKRALERGFYDPGIGGSQKIDPFQAAGGGIAKLAGVDSGPPPESGPNSQGLQGLMKRVKNV